MGIKRTEVVLQPGRSGTLEFAPGETVTGAVAVQIDGSKAPRLRAVTLKVRGKADTDWKTGSGDNETHHWETEWLLRLDLPLLPAIKGEPHSLRPGQHQLPFTFTLPDRLAYSQHHSDGKVTYECKTRLVSQSFWAFNGRARAKFQVLPYRDLSREPHLARPLTAQRKGRHNLFGRDPGPFQLNIPRQGFVAGEVIDIWLDGPDQALQALASAHDPVHLKARIVCRAGSSSTESKKILATVRPERSPAAWRHIQLPVPAGEVTLDGSSGCGIISVSHYVKVRDMHLPVTLGTVPPPLD